MIVNTDSNEIMDDLLVKYMLGEATEAERRQVDSWLMEKNENARYYEHFKLIWTQSRELAAQSTVNELEAWGRFKARTGKETPVIELNTNPWRSWIRIAAAIFVVAGVGWAVYFSTLKNSSPELVLVKSGTVAMIDTLPDGSVVTLNRRSSISYPEAFTHEKTRHITLIGEAFFDVQPDKSKPFVISVNDVTVTVVGTSFNVKSNMKQTEVIVETGLVQVEKNDNKIKINPKERVTVREGEDDLVREKSSDEFYKYYRTKTFVCNDMPLPELVEKLNEIYSSKIVIGNKKLENFRINTTFEQKSLSTDLHVIGQTFDIKVENQGDSIVLK
jgi:transmembrane sensor